MKILPLIRFIKRIPITHNRLTHLRVRDCNAMKKKIEIFSTFFSRFAFNLHEIVRNFLFDLLHVALFRFNVAWKSFLFKKYVTHNELNFMMQFLWGL